MSDRRYIIPPINQQLQEDYMIFVEVEEDPETDEPVIVGSTPLRWLLDNLEKILFVESLTEADAKTTSDPEASCPVCLENYRISRQGTIPGSEQAVLQLNEKPLKLECGHIIGKRCLRGMINPQCLGKRKCPLCRHQIHTNIKDVPLAHSDGKPDVVGALCCAIRLFLCINNNNNTTANNNNNNKPETHEVLNEWVHSPPERERAPEQQAYFAIMRNAVEKWEEVGKKRMWELVKLRMEGEFPDEEEFLI